MESMDIISQIYIPQIEVKKKKKREKAKEKMHSDTENEYVLKRGKLKFEVKLHSGKLFLLLHSRSITWVN